METRRLDDWKRVFETSRQVGSDYKPKIWSVLRIHLKDGFRQQHLYLSMFFRPLSGYTRPQRATIIASILYTSLAVNAFLFQYNGDQQISVYQRMIAAILSSFIVFVPTTVCGFLFRRCKRRGDDKKYVEDFTDWELSKMGVDLAKVNRRNWIQRHLVDWHLQWWWSCVIYGVCYACWIFCIYVTLLYGVSFRDDKAVAYFESFLTSLAISILVLQTAKAFVGGIFITITTGLVSIAVLAAIGAGEIFVLQ